MSERVGIINRAFAGGTAEVMTDRRGACGGCSAAGGCRSCLSGGAKMLSTVQNGPGAGPGDLVAIHQDRQALWAGAALFYLLPVAGLIAGAAGGGGLTPLWGMDESAAAILGGLAGAALGFTAIICVTRIPGIRARLMPRIIRVVECGKNVDAFK